ncbi:unnamed protein product [Onchocerca flexuosa]|uniref:PRP3 domain-containing protein n=1 Tax=Onchocerca flexuosa TaxID=387005 RepID=A0A183HNE7_9BILA|nr:unnamed protein product [Onchocerca flexuosa]
MRKIPAVEQQEPKLRASEELYKALPPTTFTRTISNPEVVMKKRREKKIAAKLKELDQGGICLDAGEFT